MITAWRKVESVHVRDDVLQYASMSLQISSGHAPRLMLSESMSCTMSQGSMSRLAGDGFSRSSFTFGQAPAPAAGGVFRFGK